jgi:hypothetical protein
VVLAYWCYWNDPTPPKTAVELLAAVISVASIAVGFLAAAQAIILSLNDVRIIRLLRDLHYYDRMLRYFNEAIGLSFAAAGLSAVALLKDFEHEQWHRGFEAIWVFFVCAATLCYARVMSTFFRILRSPR